MEQKFIINDTLINLILSFMHFENPLIDVTCVEDSWRNYISSGIRFVEIEGIDKDGKKTAGKFQIIDKVDDVFVIKLISD